MDSGPCPSARKLACRALPPERFLLASVHLFDPAFQVDYVGDLLVEGGRIKAVGKKLPVDSDVNILEELSGCWVFPGFVDPHAHLRTPGLEYKEDLASGLRA